MRSHISLLDLYAKMLTSYFFHVGQLAFWSQIMSLAEMHPVESAEREAEHRLEEIWELGMRISDLLDTE